jgi:hypothetical protein
MVPALKARGSIAASQAASRIEAAALIECSLRRPADFPALERVPAGGRVSVENGNGVKTNKKGIRRCKNARF